MNRNIALFRAINVGGKNSLPMKDLVKILETLGYQNIKTYIQSGNVVFSSKKKIGEKEQRKIGIEILDRKGFEPKVVFLDPGQLQKAIKDNPFPIDNGKILHFFFLESHPQNPDLERLASLKTSSEKFKLSESVFYLYAPDGLGRSKLAAAVEKSIGVPVTARNWNTVSQIAAMCEGL